MEIVKSIKTILKHTKPEQLIWLFFGNLIFLN